MRRTSPAADHRVALWPYGVLIALVAVPILWLVLAGIFWMTNRWLDWPTSATSGGLLYVAVAIGLVPVLLLVLEAVARGGGSFTTPWGGISFGSGVATSDRPAVEVETSLGFEGQPINDSMVVSVHQTLNQARANDVVRIDLGTGTNWWLTRMFALSYGATRSGAPKLFVFVGRESGIDHAYLGWIHPRDGLRLLREERSHLRFALDRAESIARYMTTVAVNVAPAPPLPPPAADPAFQPLLVPANTYATNPLFQGLGEETALRVLLDLLGKYEASSGPQHPTGGEWVTVSVLLSVFGPELHREKIDVSWTEERQLDEFFATTDDYIGILDRNRFIRIVDRSRLENDLLRQLLQPPEPARR